MAIIRSAFDHALNCISHCDISGGGLSLVGITALVRPVGVIDKLRLDTEGDSMILLLEQPLSEPDRNCLISVLAGLIVSVCRIGIIVSSEFGKVTFSMLCEFSMDMARDSEGTFFLGDPLDMSNLRFLYKKKKGI